MKETIRNKNQINDATWKLETWNQKDYERFITYLLSIQDIQYRDFHQNLIPGVDNLIGIRIPTLRAIAKEISRGNYKDYFTLVEDTYYEETMIHGLVIGYLKCDVIEVISYLKVFVPKINNWAICDSVCSGLKITNKNKKIAFDYLSTYFDSEKEYELRFAIVMLMDYFIEEEYLDQIFKICNQIKSDKYYVNMAIAWLISVAFVKEEEKTMYFLKNNQLNVVTYNKALQKIIESNRVSKDKKEFIRTMKK